MKRYLKIVLSLALTLVLAGSSFSVAEAHSSHHTRRAKGVRAAYTTGRNQAYGTADDNGVADSTSANTTAASNTVVTAPTAPDPAPTYAACYANGYCYQNETCPWDGGCIVDGACQYGGGCYGITSRNTNSGNYGHHGGRHHR